MSEITIMVPDEITKNMQVMTLNFKIRMKPEFPPILCYHDTDSVKEESEEN